MSYQKQSFGMMDEGYFVPRTEIIEWINTLLDLNLTKIEQLGSGAVYCQIIDVIHPGKVAMSKVNWKAKNDYEFIQNLKVLQTAFDKAGVKRYVEVEKLAKAKYQDNLEFIQWLKRYYDLNCGDRGSSYNPQERRNSSKVDMSFAEKNVIPKVFNSGGQITAKTQIPGKKSTVVLNNKSSVIPETKPVAPKVAQKKPEVKKQEKRKSTTINNASSVGSGKNWEKLYKQEVQKTQELTMKLQMLEQIMSSDQDSGLKLKMLEQVLGMSKSEEKASDNNNYEQNSGKVEEEYQQETEDAREEDDADAY